MIPVTYFEMDGWIDGWIYVYIDYKANRVQWKLSNLGSRKWIFMEHFIFCIFKNVIIKC